MSSPITRRSAILRMFGAFSAAHLLGWDASPGKAMRWSDQATPIIPGERFGDILLGMKPLDVRGLLGEPCEISEFEAESIEHTVKVYEYINKEMGTDLKREDAFPLRPASTHFTYNRLGLNVCFEHGQVTSITGYTGVLSGYQNELKNCFPDNHVPLGASLLKTLAEVRALCGMPEDLSSNRYAPVPAISFSYDRGISFEGRADDDRVAMITVRKPSYLNEPIRAELGILRDLNKQELLELRQRYDRPS